jgi:hypothetical protein
VVSCAAEQISDCVRVTIPFTVRAACLLECPERFVGKRGGRFRSRIQNTKWCANRKLFGKTAVKIRETRIIPDPAIPLQIKLSQGRYSGEALWVSRKAFTWKDGQMLAALPHRRAPHSQRNRRGGNVHRFRTAVEASGIESLSVFLKRSKQAQRVSLSSLSRDGGRVDQAAKSA